VITDFGLATEKTLDPRDLAGTPGYMAPELWRGDRPSTASDIYALGVILHEMVTGVKPFTDQKTESRLTVPPVAPSTWSKRLDSRWDAAILSCLDPSPAARPKDAKEVLALLIPPRRSLLMVLPFKDPAGSPDQVYFVDGLTEEVISQLGRISPKRLGVIAYYTTMRFKNSDLTISEIAANLHLEYLLLGNIRRAGDSIKVTVELVQVDDQCQLWRHVYEYSIKDLPSLQNELANKIAASLAIELLPEQQELIARAGTNNQHAYELYLQGRHLWASRTDDSVRAALDFFSRSVAADPLYALAYVGLSDCYSALGYLGALPTEEAFSNAKIYALKARQLNDHLAEAHASLAFGILQHQWDWPAAEREHRRSLELNANCSTAHHWYGITLTQVGKFEEAIAALERAKGIDPISVPILAHLGRVYYFLRDYNEAARQLRRVIQLDDSYAPARYFLGLTLVQQGHYEQAVRELQHGNGISPNHPAFLSALAFASRRAGDNRHAAEITKQLASLSKARWVDPFFSAFALLGDSRTEELLDCLWRSYEGRFGWLLYLPHDPAFNGVRKHPRFQELLRRINPLGGSRAVAQV